VLADRRPAALLVLVLALIAPLGLALAASGACEDDCGPDCGDCVVCGAPVALVAAIEAAPASERPIVFAASRGTLVAAEPRAIEHVPLPRV
jgi:hypothetical protein